MAESAAKQADNFNLTTATQCAGGKLQRAFSADKISCTGDTAIRVINQLLQIAFGFRIVSGFGTGPHCGLQLIVVKVGDNRRFVEHFQRELQRHHADTAKPDNQSRFTLVTRIEIFQC